MSGAIILAFASWEERFRDGIPRLVLDDGASEVVMFYFDAYADRTRENRRIVGEACGVSGAIVQEFELEIEDPVASWRIVRDVVRALPAGGRSVVVDISTMPREVIWWSFWCLRVLGQPINYAYFRPASYGTWLSRDPGRPRLVFRMSGIADIGVRSVLVLLSGYDVERSLQLVRFFEPESVLLGLQSEGSGAVSERRMVSQTARLSAETNVETFVVDAFAGDHGEAEIERHLRKSVGSRNVIMASLGPKLSAVAMFRLHCRLQEVGLAYAPSREFNTDYSRGIGKCVRGTILPVVEGEL